jgi:hypothetical protein
MEGKRGTWMGASYFFADIRFLQVSVDVLVHAITGFEIHASVNPMPWLIQVSRKFSVNIADC